MREVRFPLLLEGLDPLLHPPNIRSYLGNRRFFVTEFCRFGIYLSQNGENVDFSHTKMVNLLREAAKKRSFVSGPVTRGGGERVCY